MRITSCLVSLMLLSVIIPFNADAAPAESLVVGAVFGGQWVDANNSTVQNSQLADLPAIVEDYTATWCTNCVDVEHALDEVKKLNKVKNIDTDLLFPGRKRNQPIDIRVAWEKALTKAEITNFRFHDLRHSAASYLAMNGATLTEIADILGHKTLQMVKRYSHLTEQHTSKVVSKMNKQIFG